MRTKKHFHFWRQMYEVTAYKNGYVFKTRTIGHVLISAAEGTDNAETRLQIENNTRNLFLAPLPAGHPKIHEAYLI